MGDQILAETGKRVDEELGNGAQKLHSDLTRKLNLDYLFFFPTNIFPLSASEKFISRDHGNHPHGATPKVVEDALNALNDDVRQELGPRTDQRLS